MNLANSFIIQHSSFAVFLPACRIMTKKPPKGSYAFISLGCPKNLIDTERMAGLLRLDGFRLVKQPTAPISW